MTPQQEAASLGQLVEYAEDMAAAAGVGILDPTPDPRLSPDWVLRGYITAQDVVLHPFSWLDLATRVCYGFLVESVSKPGTFVAAIRGTSDATEWYIDAKFAQTPHPAGGQVEIGFWSVFQTMRYQPAELTGPRDSPVGPGIAEAVGQGTLTVIGHSLGAAVATFVTLDLAKDCGLGSRVRGRFLASPRPGDQAFADVFAANVSDAIAYARDRDEVPKVPYALGYTPLHCLQVIDQDNGEAIIASSLACQHHILSYLPDMYWALRDWSTVPVCDKSMTACLIGPRALATPSIPISTPGALQ